MGSDERGGVGLGGVEAGWRGGCGCGHTALGATDMIGTGRTCSTLAGTFEFTGGGDDVGGGADGSTTEKVILRWIMYAGPSRDHQNHFITLTLTSNKSMRNQQYVRNHQKKTSLYLHK